MATDPVGTTAPPHPPSAPPRRVAAVVVVAFCWASVLVALVGSALLGLPILGEQMFVLQYLLTALVYGPVAALLVWYRGGVVAIVLAVMAVGSATSALGSQWAFLAAAHPGLPGLWFAQHVLDRAWLPGTLAAFSFLPLLVTVRPVSRTVAVIAGVGTAASILPLLVAVVRQRPDAAPNPLAIGDPGVQEALLLVFYWSLAVAVLLAAITGVILVVRWLTWSRDDRRGLGWLALGQWMLVLFVSPSFLAWFPDVASGLSALAPLAPLIAQLFMPAAVLVLALGQRMWGLDIALNRAIVSTLVVIVLVLGYVSVVLFAGSVLPVAPTIAGAVGVAAFALAVEPVRRWIQRRVDSLVYGEAAEPAQLMRSLGARLEEGSSGAELDGLVGALRGTLRLASLSVESTRTDGVRAASGIPGDGPETRLALRNAHEVVGLVTATAPGRQALDRRTSHVLEDIAGVLSAALQLADVNEESRQTRDRIVDVRDEERRMVRRELHDGLAPALAATLGDLQRIPALLQKPDAARAAIDDVRAALAVRTGEVRDLARTLLPGSLDSGDLDAALAELAERFSSRTIDVFVTTSIPQQGALDSTRQAAVYHVVAEAVLLSRRTPRVRVIDIAVSAEGGQCTTTIAHDGDARGSDTAVVLASIADRADDLGGSLAVERGTDGLRLSVAVPL